MQNCINSSRMFFILLLILDRLMYVHSRHCDAWQILSIVSNSNPYISIWITILVSGWNIYLKAKILIM